MDIDDLKVLLSTRETFKAEYLHFQAIIENDTNPDPWATRRALMAARLEQRLADEIIMMLCETPPKKRTFFQRLFKR